MVEEKTDCGQTNISCLSTVPLELDTVLMSNECAAIFAVLRTKETLADSSVLKVLQNSRCNSQQLKPKQFKSVKLQSDWKQSYSSQ